MSSQYFPTYSVNSKSIKIKDLRHYATKTYLKILNTETSTIASKTNLADLKTRVDRIDVNKINCTDALQGKNLVEDSYLFFEPEHRYFEVVGIHTNGVVCLGDPQNYPMKKFSQQKIVSLQNYLLRVKKYL